MRETVQMNTLCVRSSRQAGQQTGEGLQHKDEKWIRFLYGHVTGRILLQFIMKSGMLKLIGRFLGTRASRPLIRYYINRHRIDMRDFEGQTYNTFQEFFARKRKGCHMDMDENHLISPCDGLLSVYPIQENRIYPIKGSHYKLEDLVDEAALAQLFESGVCLIFRLRATDYHHFCHIDEGFQYTNHFIEGALHSVQPEACERVPVYRLNRRMWTLTDTKHFGKVIQIGVGAFLVGEIVFETSCSEFKRGQEMGHFELAGSTIVMLFQKDRIRLREQIREQMETGEEVGVRMGEMIGYTEVREIG